MNILLVNDDGIEALGLKKLMQALNKEDNVYICAPHREQSASGHSITIGRLVYIDDVEIEGAVAAIAMEGEPADCVKIGLEIYKNRGVKIDLVFSGFNHGMNLGTDTLYSGTVAAAVEGALCGIPSVAMSISSNFKTHKEPENFDVAMKVAEQAAMYMKKRINSSESDKKDFGVDFMNDTHSVLSINIPDLPEDEIQGLKVVPLGYRAYKQWFMSSVDDDGRVGYHYSGRPLEPSTRDENSSDVVANSLGYITVTPLQFNMTCFRTIDATREEWKDVFDK